ncbi:hypothetical protein BY996DRAFT_6585826 [Phakopsora pachyrhizi]|nr:hypothetical protein BY996DRAFT_6585826 [Phakopsora pachyrhizi]
MPPGVAGLNLILLKGPWAISRQKHSYQSLNFNCVQSQRPMAWLGLDNYQGKFDALMSSMDHKMDQSDVSSVDVPLTLHPTANASQENRQNGPRKEPGTLSTAVAEILEMADNPKSNGFWIPATEVASIRTLLKRKAEIMAKFNHALEAMTARQGAFEK